VPRGDIHASQRRIGGSHFGLNALSGNYGCAGILTPEPESGI